MDTQLQDTLLCALAFFEIEAPQGSQSCNNTRVPKHYGMAITTPNLKNIHKKKSVQLINTLQTSNTVTPGSHYVLKRGETSVVFSHTE